MPERQYRTPLERMAVEERAGYAGIFSTNLPATNTRDRAGISMRTGLYILAIALSLTGIAAHFSYLYYSAHTTDPFEKERPNASIFIAAVFTLGTNFLINLVSLAYLLDEILNHDWRRLENCEPCHRSFSIEVKPPFDKKIISSALAASALLSLGITCLPSLEVSVYGTASNRLPAAELMSVLFFSMGSSFMLDTALRLALYHHSSTQYNACYHRIMGFVQSELHRPVSPVQANPTNFEMPEAGVSAGTGELLPEAMYREAESKAAEAANSHHKARVAFAVEVLTLPPISADPFALRHCDAISIGTVARFSFDDN